MHTIEKTWICDFCSKHQKDAEIIVAAENGAGICDECVETCVRVIKEHRVKIQSERNGEKTMRVFDNHYKYLDEIVPRFFELVGVNFDINAGIVSAHGDKCYSQRSEWEEQGIPFNHGVAVYLLTYVRPYGNEVRETDEGWVPPHIWVGENYHRFKDALEQVDQEFNIKQVIKKDD